eukprot:Platyproteum_vivax@DN10943_c0_g1_i1.p1
MVDIDDTKTTEDDPAVTLTKQEIRTVLIHARNLGIHHFPQHNLKKWSKVLKASLEHDTPFIRVVLTYIKHDETDFENLTSQAMQQRIEHDNQLKRNSSSYGGANSISMQGFGNDNAGQGGRGGGPGGKLDDNATSFTKAPFNSHQQQAAEDKLNKFNALKWFRKGPTANEKQAATISQHTSSFNSFGTLPATAAATASPPSGNASSSSSRSTRHHSYSTTATTASTSLSSSSHAAAATSPTQHVGETTSTDRSHRSHGHHRSHHRSHHRRQGHRTRSESAEDTPSEH